MTREEAAAVYAAVMDEIKVRISAARSELSILYEKQPDPTAFVHAEAAYLQVRFVCELIALGALTAHHDAPGAASKSFQDEWHADQLLKKLADINVESFPRAVRPKSTDEPLNLEFNDGAQLTREQLGMIYGRCGNFLHRGRLRRGPKGLRRPYDVKQIEDWLDGLIGLLEYHVILIPTLRSVLIVKLGAPGESVSIRFGDALGDFEVKRPSQV